MAQGCKRIFTRYPSYEALIGPRTAHRQQPAPDFVAGINNVGGTPDVLFSKLRCEAIMTGVFLFINELKILAVNANWSYLYETWLESQVGPCRSGTNFESTVFLMDGRMLDDDFNLQ